jgi:peroxiredoxin
MKSRWSANRWAFTALVVLIGLLGIDIGRRWMFPHALASAADQAEAAASPDPPFKVGDLAPDFKLPDKDGTQHSLSELAAWKETLLCFTCGCGNCREVQTYMASALRRMGANAPQVVTVTSMSPEAEAAWTRDTKLKQTLLYDAKTHPITKQYKGHPCPRVFGLKDGVKVAWIGRLREPEEPLGVLESELTTRLGIKHTIPASEMLLSHAPKVIFKKNTPASKDPPYARDLPDFAKDPGVRPRQR